MVGRSAWAMPVWSPRGVVSKSIVSAGIVSTNPTICANVSKASTRRGTITASTLFLTA